MGSIDALQSFMATVDLDALGAALGDELAGEVLGQRSFDRPSPQVTLERDDLASLLAAAAKRGVARFLSSAALEADFTGPDTRLADTVATVREALGLLCTPEEAADRATRAARATAGIHVLVQLVNEFERGDRRL